jgi:P4 family phage/plasmid primase-like protien
MSDAPLPDDPIIRLEQIRSQRQTAAPPPDEYSDDALALKFTARHAASLRFVAPWGRWLQWDGARWKFEDTLAAFDMARAVARDEAQVCNKPSERTRIASAKTVAAIERLARADRAHARTVDIWDTDPWLLNSLAAIVALQTGDHLSHDPQFHITKVTAVAPGGDCPLWRRFLERITDGDLDLQAYLQRVAGYCLTAITREHALFFCYGTGSNGKSVFLNTLTGILGDYAAVAPMEAFMASRNERHPTDLAGLRGARLVTAQEIEDGQCWAESKIKALTGGDPISARFMKQDFFTFTPQFKLVIAGNHKPALRTVDEAIRRRLHLIPFQVTIPEDERDQQLAEKLKAEWPGILQWAIDGCLEWQQIGLVPPPCVTAATEDYLEAEDSVSQWLAECCCVDKTYSECGSDLFANWKAWAEKSGEPVGSHKRFAQALADRGFAHGKDSRTRRAVFYGIALPAIP